MEYLICWINRKLDALKKVKWKMEQTRSIMKLFNGALYNLHLYLGLRICIPKYCVIPVLSCAKQLQRNTSYCQNPNNITVILRNKKYFLSQLMVRCEVKGKSAELKGKCLFSQELWHWTGFNYQQPCCTAFLAKYLISCPKFHYLFIFRIWKLWKFRFWRKTEKRKLR